MKFKKKPVETREYAPPKRVIEPAKDDKIYFYLEPIIQGSSPYFKPHIARNLDK